MAAGSSTNYFGIDGADEHAFPLYSLDDAVRLRNRVLEQFEAADRDPSLVDDGALTFVLVGGGPTGVELAGALAELFDKVLREDFHDLRVHRARVVLVEMADASFSPLPGPAASATPSTPSAGAASTCASPPRSRPSTPTTWSSRVASRCRPRPSSGPPACRPTRSPSSLGVEPGSRAAGSSSATTCRSRATAGAGPSATSPTWCRRGEYEGEPLPQLAPAAMQAGATAAANILPTSPAQPTEPFRYRNKGTMATIGRRSAVAEIPRLPPLVGLGGLAGVAGAAPRGC